MEQNQNISLKEKCYGYQKAFDYRLDINKPILVHIDGKNFSKMVKNRFKKPFDEEFTNAMDETAKFICASVQGVKLAYVQSDEISLLITKDTPESDIFYGGRLCKMQSILASLATSKFQQIMTKKYLDSDSYDNEPICDIDSMPLYQFDCKVWNVDNINDAFAWLLFRNIDCVRNSKQQAAQTYMSHKELMNHSADEQVEMLKLHYGIDWDLYREGFKYGRIITKQTYTFKELKPEIRLEEEAYFAKSNLVPGVDIDIDIQYSDDDFIEVTRNRWTVSEGRNLTIKENREWLAQLCPSLINEKIGE